MATESIQQSGSGDRLNITAWEAALSATLSSPEVGQIDDANEYSDTQETFPINPTATATATNYARLTVGASYRHDGAAGTSNARIYMDDAAGQHVFHLQSDYFQIDYLEIYQETPGASDEGIRVQADYCLIKNNVIWTDTSAADCDGIYIGDWDVADCYISHNVMYGWTRAGINLQNYNLYGIKDQTAHIDYCTIIGCGQAGEVESGGIHAKCRDNDSTTTVHVYNTYCGGTASTYPDFNDDGAGNDTGSVSWNGSYNGCSDTSLTNEAGLTTGAQESVAVNTTQFVNVTGGSEDYDLPGTGSALYGVALSRVGSEPDSRQDFSADIVGNARSTTTPSPDIGAFEYTAGGATTKTKTASLDALLSKADNLKTTSIDALLQKTTTLQASVDALLLQTLTKTTSIDAVLQAGGALTTSLDALLKKAGLTKTTSLDALLQKSLTKTTSLDALLQKALTLTTSLDSLLQATGTKTTSIDSVIISAGSPILTTSIDALLKQTLQITLSVDALLRKNANTLSFSIDSNIHKIGLLTNQLDAILRKNGLTLTVSVDSVLQSMVVVSDTYGANSLMKGTAGSVSAMGDGTDGINSIIRITLGVNSTI